LKASSLCYASGKEFVPIARRQALYHKFQHAAGQRRRKGPRATARRRALPLAPLVLYPETSIEACNKSMFLPVLVANFLNLYVFFD
jgi:hypothetical protein